MVFARECWTEFYWRVAKSSRPEANLGLGETFIGSPSIGKKG
jgi:hypothetical protein